MIKAERSVEHANMLEETAYSWTCNLLFIIPDCRKITRSGLTAACNDDEMAVGCRTTGFDGCSARQAYYGQGCMVNCGDDVEKTLMAQGILKALCCKRKAVRIQSN